MLREYSGQIAGDAAFSKMISGLALHTLLNCCHIAVLKESSNRNTLCCKFEKQLLVSHCETLGSSLQSSIKF